MGSFTNHSGSVTLDDIARIVGVSRATVSRALSGRTKATWPSAAAQVHRIQEVARQLNYEPSAIGRAMATGRSMTLGVVMDAAQAKWVQAQALGTLELMARERGYACQLAGVLLTEDLEPVVKQMLPRVDGLVIMYSHCNVPALERMLRQSGAPHVFMGYVPPWAAHGVYPEFGSALRKLASHLVKLKHRRGLYLGTRDNLQSPGLRIDPYRSAMSEAGIELTVDPDMMFDWDLQEGLAARRAVEKAGRKGLGRFSFILANNDDIALGAVAGLYAIGLEVPGDMSVIGFDDAPHACVSRPALTTMKPPLTDMATLAFNTLMPQMKEYAVSLGVQELSYELVMRDSVGVARRVKAGGRAKAKG